MIKKIVFKTEKKTESNIVIGENCIENLCTMIDLSQYSSVGVVFDKITHELFSQKIQSLLNKLNRAFVPIIIGDGEQSKSIETTQTIYKQLLERGFDRKSMLIAVGGGVVGDLAGFVAGTYMRGIDYINIPTTLLSQVDSSIGGKTGVNFGGLKNMIGVTHQPRFVICDINFLNTLPERQLKTGFAEIIKYGLIEDKSILDLYEKKDLLQLVIRCVEIKSRIVEQDPLDKLGIREKLNFGHTLGHAIETLSNGELTHGEAISIGIVFATKLSNCWGLLQQSEVERIKKIFLKIGLPITYRGDTKKIMEKITHDKKNVGKKIKFVLLKKIGEAVTKQEVTNEHISEALKEVLV